MESPTECRRTKNQSEKQIKIFQHIVRRVTAALESFIVSSVHGAAFPVLGTKSLPFRLPLTKDNRFCLATDSMSTASQMTAAGMLCDSHSNHNLTNEATQLISAFKQFVTSLVRPSPSQLGNTHIQGASEEGAAPGKDETSQSSEQTLLEISLEKARRTVFNDMPIRLLQFNANGTDIRLVERSEIWLTISSQMERDFALSQFQEEIFPDTCNLQSYRTPGSKTHLGR